MRIIAFLFLCTVVNTYTGGDDLVSLDSIKEYQDTRRLEDVADCLMPFINTPSNLDRGYGKYFEVINKYKQLIKDGYVECGADITRVIGKMNPERSGATWTKKRIELYKETAQKALSDLMKEHENKERERAELQIEKEQEDADEALKTAMNLIEKEQEDADEALKTAINLMGNSILKIIDE